MSAAIDQDIFISIITDEGSRYVAAEMSNL